MRIRLALFLAMLALALPASAMADDGEVPYWASIRSREVNMRVGPAEDYQILWVFRRKLLPLKVLRIKEGWRLVEDPDGAQGWMRAQFLTRDRTGFVRGSEPAEMKSEADGSGRLLWRLAPGVVGLLGDCANVWCAFDVEGRKGYVAANRLWGADAP